MDDDLDGLGREELTWPKFLRGCLRYRESLDRDLPNAPVADVEYE